MKALVIFVVHLLTAVARLVGPGGAKALVAENLLIKHQFLILTRSRQRAPNLRPLERFLLGFLPMFIRQGRLPTRSVGLRPGTLL